MVTLDTDIAGESLSRLFHPIHSCGRQGNGVITHDFAPLISKRWISKNTKNLGQTLSHFVFLILWHDEDPIGIFIISDHLLSTGSTKEGDIDHQLSNSECQRRGFIKAPICPCANLATKKHFFLSILFVASSFLLHHFFLSIDICTAPRTIMTTTTTTNAGSLSPSHHPVHLLSYHG
jgi:hypothetical protein